MPGRAASQRPMISSERPPEYNVGSVDEVPAALDEQVQLRMGGLLVALVAERHRAEASRRHDRPRAAQGAVFHGHRTYGSRTMIDDSV